eukprot:CAMPEP_0176255714 /NCGR_PEP_ID=MMETSP0121_2-20121125/37181_1 /TAXON_ID=160619 /ORGANISM="Kryptoperidinium foliaceum, Strain CCMP 1326" /LENGTH=358 /DNA_ID=CAMNT_0017595545 /DNA_START=8 /DNA_END=1084 /DNA_ORIENTATION=+
MAPAGIQAPERCFEETFPQTRSDFPAFLNCLGLVQEAVEVGVQAGVHASSFLEAWRGKRLRLVDKWGPSDDASSSDLFYIDIANTHGPGVRRKHRAHCEARLAEQLRSGRAEIVSSDSVAAASAVPDASVDFVYLDARHDFAGVVADIQAWWPKVRVGGIFAGHDYVDGEFPEGDFFWISALHETLQGLAGRVKVTQEKDRYPSFFVLKTPDLAALRPSDVGLWERTRRLYAERSRYFPLWRAVTAEGAGDFDARCNSTCGVDCEARAATFTPTRSAVSTLRPFACGDADRAASPESAPASGVSVVADQGGDAPQSSCASEMVLDVKAYLDVCLERCVVTCAQRRRLFAEFGDEILAV